MRMKKTLAAASALAIAIAMAPVTQLQAASLINAGSLQVDSLVQVVKAKKHARSRRPGSCGENMYWSRKDRHCMDARDKA
jgi:uncharacterized low-complexity protein